MSNIFYWVKKKRLVWVVFRIEEIRDKDNATGVKEGGGRRNRNVNLQCFSIIRDARSLFRLKILTGAI